MTEPRIAKGHFTVDLEDGHSVRVSGKQKAELPPDLVRIPGLQRVLDFYRLACTPQHEADNRTPLANGYQATMLAWAGAKLTELRYRMPAAGGLVIAPSIEMAKYFVTLIQRLEGDTALLVHSQMPNPDAKIKAFRNTDKRWLVSVAMVSEGVDIRRLRVLVYLPHALTELALRQAIGRVVRTAGPDDDTRAYVVMPSFEILEGYARRVEDEMSPGARTGDTEPRMKRCPICRHECGLGKNTCPQCGYEFPAAKRQFKPCGDCGSLNPAMATSCQVCGSSFSAAFTLTLDEALRAEAIVRGMDLDEHEVQKGEEMASKVRSMVLKSGDARLVRVLSTLPEESWARLREILVSNG